MSTTVNTKLLTVLAQHNPRLWEILHPHVAFESPQPEPWLAQRGTFHLGPQPIPWVVGYQQAQVMAVGAIAASDQGGLKQLAVDVEDWCGTGWPHKWPWPGPGPRPRELDAEVREQLFAGAALGLAQVAGGYDGGELQEGFAAAAEQLAAQVGG